MSMTTISPRSGLRGWHVLAIITGFFAVVVAVDVAFAVMAVRTFPGQVAKNPYEDGIEFNRRLAREAAQARLGWRATAAVGEGGAVVVEVFDRAGGPVAGLSAAGKLERPATEAGRLTPPFAEVAPGRYVARPGGLAGSWDLTFVANDRQGRRFEAERRLTWP